jgi:NAD(P)H dehydrogenase (quinone)
MTTTALLLEGWLMKAGNGMGGWKNRYCSLTFANNQFILDYFVAENKAEKKGAFVLARKSGFAKAADSGENKSCFTLDIVDSDSMSRKTGTKVTFSAPSPVAFALWEKAFESAKAPVGVMPGLGKSFGRHELVVLGASSKVSSVVLQTLSGFTKDFIVRATSRDLSKVKLPATVKGFVGDMSQAATLAVSIADTRCVFVYVPNVSDRAQLGINTIKACKENKVQHIVLFSYVGAAGGPGSVLAAQYRAVEEHLKTSGIPYTIVRAPILIESALMHLPTIAATLQFTSCLDTKIKFNAVASADLGEAIAKIMMKPEQYINKILNLTGPPVSESDFADTFTSIMGKKVTHAPVSYEEARASYAAAGLPEWRIGELIEMNQMIATGEPCLTAVPSDLPAVLGRVLTNLAIVLLPCGPELRAMRDAVEKQAKIADDEMAAKLEAMKLNAGANADAIKAVEKITAEKAAREEAAVRLQKTRAMIHDGGMVLKKMGNETAFKLRFVWVDEEKKKLNWSKTMGDNGSYKSIDLNGNVVLTKPEFSAAKPAAMFGTAEPEGHIITVTAPGQPSVDLKIGDSIQDANAWYTAIQLLCVNKKSI